MNSARRPRLLGMLLLCAILLAPAILTLPASASSGTLAPPHADAGVDTNGDRLFNFLRIDVNLQVATPGAFTVKIVLNDDLDLGKLTEASNTANLAGGSQVLSVFLDGPDIYNGGVNGPFYAHLTLLSDYGQILGTGVHKTVAYGFADFQPYAARLVPPNSEKTLDNDTDGLVNWIDLGFTLDVATAGTYTLSSLLTDSQYTASIRWIQTRSLGAGRLTLHQLFIGYPLRLLQRNGPYLVTNSLTDRRGVEIDFLYVQTSAYSYTIFEGSPVLLAPPHSDRGVDSDGDGLYNILQVNVRVSAETAGTYTVRGRLLGTSGVGIAETAEIVGLPVGLSSASLSFSGWAIYDSGIDGPYSVDLQVYDTSSLLLSSGTYTTATYLHTAFQPRAVSLDPPHEDQAVDFNNDGKFDVLRLSVHLDVMQAASVRIEAALRQGVLAPDLVRATTSARLEPGPRIVTLDFPGSEIHAAAVNGPYWAVISVRGANDSLLDQGNHRTEAYLASDFDAVPIGASLSLAQIRAEDIEANGLYNRLRVTVSINVTLSGQYRLDGDLLRDSAFIANATCVMTLAVGLNTMDLVFGGQDIRSSGRDGPYAIHAVLSSVVSNVAMAFADFGTSTYSASSFERADRISLSGQIVALQNGLPLAGASVWLVDYANYTSRQTVTDSQGTFALSTFKGSYSIVVDHPNTNAQVIRRILTGDTALSVSLAPPARNTVRDTLTWAGWDELLLSVRYTFNADGLAYRLRSDWWYGNRDGRVVSTEWSDLDPPVDAYRGMIDAGTSGDSFSVNGRTFSAVAGAVVGDAISGDVFGTSPPSLEVSRLFRADSLIGTPDRLEILFPVYEDTLAVDRTMRLFVPARYRFVSVTDIPSVSVRARKYLLPISVEPDIGSNLAEPPSVVSLQMLFYILPTYVAPTPAPPSDLSAFVNSFDVLLSWARPTTNVDGSHPTNIGGYRVYRSTSPSGPFALVGAFVTSEQFVDRPGLGAFYYQVAAVNTDGVEGPKSEMVSASVLAAQLLVVVLDAQGTAVNGAEVTLLDLADAPVAQSRTDASGKAWLIVPPGLYTIRVAAEGISAEAVRLVLSAGMSSVTISVERLSQSQPASFVPAIVLIAVVPIVVGTGAFVSLIRLRRKRDGLIRMVRDSSIVRR